MRSPERTHAPLWLSCLIFAATFGTVWADVSGEITGVKLQSDDKRIVIESSGTLGKHLARVIGKPNRIVMDFEDAKVNKVPAKIAGSGQVSEIRVGNVKSRARVVVDFQNHPIPPFHVRRDGGRVLVIFGTPLLPGGHSGESQAMDAQKSEPAFAREAAAVPAPTKASGSKGNFAAPAGQGASADKGVERLAAESQPITPDKSVGAKRPVGDDGRAAPSNPKEEPAGMKPVKLAQRVDLERPNPPISSGRERAENQRPGDASARPNFPPSAQGPVSGGGQMVREVRPPVTPPTPDPRLLVQDITELKFIQVGHNARLIVRGGDHLDYRLIRVSPTKLKVDLINAEIPKLHQKPLRTDLFSTSVEMIVPGSQSIFIQLKDSVPHQVEKQKGVLMIDFPPPRFQMTADQRTAGRPADTGAREAFQQAGETRREAVRVMKEEEILKTNEARRKTIESLQKQQEDLEKQRSELTKRYRVTPDPAIFSKPVTMDFQGISLRNAFRLLAEQAGINIILDDKVTGSTTLRLFQVPLGQVIDTILTTHELDREMMGNVMRVGKAADIKKLKDDRQKEYADRLKEVDKRSTDIRNEMQKNQSEIEKNLKDLEKVETGGEGVPTEDIRAEEVGEAGCIKLKGEDVCFFYATVKLVYAKPDDIVKTLRCMFNLDCPGAKTLGQQVSVGDVLAGAAAETQKAREAYQDQLQQQGFMPGSVGLVDRMREFDRTQADRTRAAAATTQAAVAATGGPQAQAQVTLPYGTDEDLAKIIAYSMLWPDDKNRMIFIKDTYERIAQMKKVIYALDVPIPQVLIESRLVQAIRGWSRGLGIRWGGKNNQTGYLYGNLSRQNFWSVQGTGAAAQELTPGATTPPRPQGTEPASQFLIDLPATAGVLMGAGINFGLLATNYVTELDARLSIGEATNKTKIISRPKVQVMDNEKALIKNGLSIPYTTTGLGGSTQTQMIDADLKLEVKPKIYIDGRIKMEIKVSDDEPEAVQGTLSIRRRQAETFMIVKDGETAVIGGILRTNDSGSRGGWPGLMNIPLLNILFSNKSTSNAVQELLVFITPTIVKRPPSAS